MNSDYRFLLYVTLLAAAVLFLAFFSGASIQDFAMGFVSGIALYALFWRWKYGHWPD